jgi:hypothetical protein
MFGSFVDTSSVGADLYGLATVPAMEYHQFDATVAVLVVDPGDDVATH